MQWLPALLLGVGVLLTLLQQRAIDDEVFFSGDGGVKALMVRQFAAGNWHADLRLDADAPTRELWARGLYPLGPPFVYEVGERRFVQFPLLFMALTAPFYDLFGFRGLTFLPLIGLWTTWGALLWLCRRAGLAPSAKALALAGTILASHLTPYGAMFWEHTLGVGASALGLAALWPGREGQTLPRRAAIAGALLGLACWFRPESACFALAAVVGAWVAGAERGVLAAAAAGLALPLFAFAAWNQWLHGSVMGLHAVQQLDPAMHEVLEQSRWTLLHRRNNGLLWYSPVLILSAAGALLGVRRTRLRIDRNEAGLWVVLLVFLATIVWVVPPAAGKQIGPRYLLHAVPVLWLIAALQWQRWEGIGRLGTALRIGALALLLAGAFRNGYRGNGKLLRDYEERVLPTLVAVRAEPARRVAVEHQYMAQELEAAMGEKTFFLVDDPSKLDLLAETLFAAGEPDFLLLLYEPTELAREYAGFSLRVVASQRAGRFVLHRCALEPS